MANDYRLCFIGADNRTVKYRLCAARDDLDALDQARGLIDAHEIEVWCGARFVARVAADGNASERSAPNEWPDDNHPA